MADEQAPAVAEGTEQALPAGEATPQVDTNAAPTEPPAEQQPGESDAQHRRRIIEAARLEKRTRAERIQAEKARAEAAEQAKRVESWQREAAEVRQRLERFEQMRQNALRDPRAFMAEVGLDLDTIVRAHLDEGPTPDVLVRDVEKRALSEIEKRDKQLQELQRKFQEREEREQRAQAEAAARSLQNDIASHIEANRDKYELTVALEQQDEVFELMRMYYEKFQRVLPIEKAADMLEETLYAQAKKAAGAKKLAALFKPAEPTPAPAGKPATQAKSVTDARENKASPHTLSAKLATSPAQPEAEETFDVELLAKRAAERVRTAKDAKRAAK